MFLFVKWKIDLDLEDENKFKILSLSTEKEDNIKYIISTKRYKLCDINIDFNYDPNQIYYTRMKIIGDHPFDKLYYFIYKKINYETNSTNICVYITRTSMHRLAMLKEFLSSNIYNKVFDDNFLNNNIYQDEEYYHRNYEFSKHRDNICNILDKHKKDKTDSLYFDDYDKNPIIIKHFTFEYDI